MSYVINLLEALIVSYGLVELCKIDKKKIFFILNTIITFGISNIFDCIDQNFMPLSVVYVILWCILIVIFNRKNIIYNFLFIVFIDLLCSLCAFLPILTLYKYSRIIAGLMAKIIQLIMTYEFIKFKRKYDYFEDKYWLTIIVVLLLGEIIIVFQMEQVIENGYLLSCILISIFIIIIMGISLYFFQLIEESNLEKERITKLYEK